MKSFVTTDILEEKLDKEFSLLFTGIIAEIDSYNKTQRTAKVLPLAKIETRKGFERLPAVTLPICMSYGNGMEIIPDFKKGDLVYLAPNLLPTENQIKSHSETDFSRKHKLENMVIIGGVTKQPSVLNPLMNKDGLVITDNQSMYAQFSSDLVEFKIGNDSTQKGILGEDLVDTLDDLCSKLDDLINAIKTLTVTCTAPGSPSSPPTNVSQFITVASDISQIKSNLNDLLSSKIKYN